ncbi:MAG: hypothetical protein ACI4KL_06785 [Lentihominibacter sp.]
MKFYKKALAWLVCLTMLLSMSTGIAFASDAEAVSEAAGTDNGVEQQLDTITDDADQSADTEEPESEEPEIDALAEGEVAGGSIELVVGEETKVITAAEIKAAASVTATAENPWAYVKDSVEHKFVGTFYSLKSILETAGISCDEAHGLKSVADDGFVNGFAQDEIDDVYIYDQGEVKAEDGTAVGAAGTYGLAINGSAGNKWAKGVVRVEVANDHVWFIKNETCKHYCAICGEDEPSITVKSEGNSDVAIHDCEIKSTASATATAENPWTNMKGSKYVGTFYSLKSILETAGIGYDSAHGLKVVATDGFVNGFTKDEIDELYIYDQGEVIKNGAAAGTKGIYGTAINGAEVPGNKWANKVATIEIVSDHVWFIREGACYHYCAICNEKEKDYCSFGQDQLFEVDNEVYTLQELVNEKTSEGTVDGTVMINRDVDYGDKDVTIDAVGRTVTLDLNGKTLTANKLIVKNGTVQITGGTLKADMAVEGGIIKAIGGKYSIEVPSEMCGENMVPVYLSDENLYEVKAVSAYDSQKTANELEKTIKTLEAQIAQLSAKIEAGSATVTVKAAATAYNKVTLTWEADQPVDGFTVEKKIDDVWTAITPDADGKYIDTTEPGIANAYRVAAYAEYGTDQKESGKWVTATAKTTIGKAAVSSLTSKSKKLTVKWKSVSGASAYDVYVGTNSAVTKGLVKYTNVKSLSKVTKKLKKGKTYYVKVRARVTNSKGTTVYGAWSTAKKIKCK